MKPDEPLKKTQERIPAGSDSTHNSQKETLDKVPIEQIWRVLLKTSLSFSISNPLFDEGESRVHIEYCEYRGNGDGRHENKAIKRIAIGLHL